MVFVLLFVFFFFLFRQSYYFLSLIILFSVFNQISCQHIVDSHKYCTVVLKYVAVCTPCKIQSLHVIL